MSDLKIFTDNIESEAWNQIYTLIKQPAFADCKVRIMPDVHAGKGCVIGFTADLGDKVIPNIVGVDIGCGMLCIKLGKIDLDCEKVDQIIKKYIPAGQSVHEKWYSYAPIDQLYCKNKLKNREWLDASLGTLGGGNHFIEFDRDDDGCIYLVIHTGSRNLGKQVADIYQQMAIDDISGINDLPKRVAELIAEHKKNGKQKDIEKEIKALKASFSPECKIPRDLCYLTGEHRDMYLHDMNICQKFAWENRERIADLIIRKLFGHSFDNLSYFHTVHNYIDHDSNIVRKGAISAKLGERVIIPINMRDGSIIAIGKGNEDWNCSAPHGAGRIMSRSKAKENVSLEEYQESMKGIYTTSVSQSTIDESPMAYKSMDEILEHIKDTVEIVKIIKPVYNFKASE